MLFLIRLFRSDGSFIRTNEVAKRDIVISNHPFDLMELSQMCCVGRLIPDVQCTLSASYKTQSRRRRFGWRKKGSPEDTIDRIHLGRFEPTFLSGEPVQHVGRDGRGMRS